MLYKPQNSLLVILVFGIFILVSLSCQAIGLAPQVTQDLKAPLGPEIILQRLDVSFLGQDGKRVIGSGCPGNDGKGEILDYHFVVGGVDESKEVQRVLVAGDHSTLTWASPCSNNWALKAANLGNGIWEIFIAPSMSSKIYTVLFFYTDGTVALGMVNAE